MRRQSGRCRSRAILGLALATAAALPAAGWADVERRSGTVVAVDNGAGAFVIEEVGLGRAGRAGNDIARLRITLGPATPVVAVARSAGVAPDGWPGGFAETPTGPEALREGAFVTVTLRRERGRLIAEHVTVAAPEP